MKVLWITANFRPEIGGMQTYTEQLAEILAKSHQVGIVTAWGQEPHAKSRLRHWSCAGLRSSRFRFQWNRARRKLRLIAQNFRPDLIHLANAGMAVYSDVLSDIAPMVVSLHGNDFLSPWQITPGSDTVSLIRAGLLRCRKRIAVSRYVANKLPGFGVNNGCEVIHNSCDLSLFHPRQINRSEVLHRWLIPSDKEIILTVSRLDRRKGHGAVLEALRQLERPWHWVIVGDGRCGSELASQIARHNLTARVTFTGTVVAESLARLYCAADLFVLTPLVLERDGRLDSEGFGIVFHEANACGLPVVVSDTAGCREAVVPGETALAVAPGDSEALCAAINALLSDRPRAAALARQGLEYVQAVGGWEAVARRVARLYGEMETPAVPAASYTERA